MQAAPATQPPPKPAFESLQENSLDYGNKSMMDDTPLLARIAAGYDTLSQSALITLGADASTRSFREKSSNNPNREALFGPPISGAMIRQLNRMVDFDIAPLISNAKLKLLLLRNTLVAHIDSFEDPEIALSGILSPENVNTDDIRFVHRNSGQDVISKLKAAGLSKLSQPYITLYSGMIEFMNNGNMMALTNLKFAIRLMVTTVAKYRERLGPLAFNNLVLACAVAESAIDGLTFANTQKQKATYELQSFYQALTQK